MKPTRLESGEAEVERRRAPTQLLSAAGPARSSEAPMTAAAPAHRPGQRAAVAPGEQPDREAEGEVGLGEERAADQQAPARPSWPRRQAA